LALAGLAALRSGCDWVTIAAPEKVAWSINALNPDLVTVKLKGDYISLKHYNELIKLSKKYDVILIGNGIGLKEETKDLIKKIVINVKNKLKVIDADAIKSLSINDLNNSIITPHKKEFQILLKNSEIDYKLIKIIINEKNIEKKAQLIKKSSNKNLIKNNIILLKGQIDVIISINKISFNKTGNAGMTKAGTGDVLAGLCAGFLAQSKDLEQSAINAAYFNGLAGDNLLKKKKGFTYLASDLVDEINRILN